MPQEAVLTTGPAARRIGITENTLRSWAQSGKVAHIRMPNGRLRFRVSDLDAMVQVIEPSTDAA
jgi:excisionase family DNA binding protein